MDLSELHIRAQAEEGARLRRAALARGEPWDLAGVADARVRGLARPFPDRTG